MRLNYDWTPQACWSPMGLHWHVSLWWGMLVSENYVGLRSDMSVSDGACPSLMGLRSGMSVSDESCRYLWWVSDQACRHVGMSVSHEACRGLWSGMLVSDCNYIFVNLLFTFLMCRLSEANVARKVVAEWTPTPIKMCVEIIYFDRWRL